MVDCRVNDCDSQNGIFISLFFFIWITGFFWQFIGCEGVVRFVELLSSLLAVTYLLNLKIKTSRMQFFIYFFVYLFLLIFFSYVRDVEAPYKDVLFLKTSYYIFFGIFSGVAFFDYFYKYKGRQEIFCRCNAIFSVIIIFWVLLLALQISWFPGLSLLGTYIGDSYQGISRIVSLCVLISICLNRYLPILIVIIAVFSGLLILLSLNSFGAFFAIILAAVFLARQKIYAGISHFLIFGVVVSLSIGFIVFFVDISDITVFKSLGERLQGKLLSQSVDDQQGRIWLMSAGLNFWISDVWSFVFGYGPMNYACSVGFCDAYRHPHNILVEVLVWFGLAGIPLILILMWMFYKSLFYFFMSKSSFTLVISAISLNCTLLALIGGDFEQNRYLIFISSVIIGFHISNKRFKEKVSV